jgi:hypothetical protein
MDNLQILVLTVIIVMGLPIVVDMIIFSRKNKNKKNTDKWYRD